MLHLSTVDSTLLRILRELMKISALKSSLLVGGTSLALQLGHRKSIDIDLFGNIDFQSDVMNPILSDIGALTVIKKSNHINIVKIDDVKLDFVNYRYPWISDPVQIDGIRLASIEDIAAMKLNAIAGRGSKKDFVDLYFLLALYTIEELFGFYSKKFDDGNLFLVEKSLYYFEDAETQEMPVMLIDVSWEQVKERIKRI